MPTKPRVEPDLTALRWCRLLEAIRAAVPEHGRPGWTIRAAVEWLIQQGGYTAAEYRAAIKALRECGAITYSRGIYRRGSMF